MGYETHNSLLNLGSVTLFFCLYLIALIILAILKMVEHFTGKGTSIVKGLKKKLVYGFLISLLMEPYIELLISSYLNIKAPVSIENGDQIGIYTAYLGAICACGILPLSFIWVITRDNTKLEDASFKETWGSFYDETKGQTI